MIQSLVKSLILGLALLVGCTAWADPVLEHYNVVNWSFEDPIRSDNQWSTYVPGWNVVKGNAGVFNPPISALPSGPTHGQNILWMGSNATVAQTLSTIVSPYYDYTLKVDVGQRADNPPIRYAIQLWAGSTLVAEDNDTLNPASGGFLTSTLTFSTGASSPLFGNAFEIRFLNLSTTGQVIFDNVRFMGSDPTPAHAPEPATLALFGSGLLAASLKKRFKK
ncbi:MAG: PEP-CTERM sorting domain-containing protein [Candidatus Korobacteraceae bacterium]